MKKISLLLLFSCFVLSIHAQVPMGFKYQGAARDVDGDFVSDSEIAINLVLLRGGITRVYEERHTSVMTNDYGVFSLIAGQGETTFGTFNAIDWGADSYFMRIEIDIDLTDGISYRPMGMTQLLSVPYALFAENTGNINDSDADPFNEIQSLSLTGNDLSLSHGGGMVTLPGGTGSEWWDIDNPIKQHLYNTNLGAIQLGNNEYAKSYLTINADYGSVGGQLFLTDGMGESQLNMAFNKTGSEFSFFKLRSMTDDVGPKFTILGSFEDDTPYEYPLWELNYEGPYITNSFGPLSADSEIRIRGNDYGTSILNMQFSHGTDDASKSWSAYASEYDKNKRLENIFIEYFAGGGVRAKKGTGLTLDSTDHITFEVFGSVTGETASFISEDTVNFLSEGVYISTARAINGLHVDLERGGAAILGHGFGDVAAVVGMAEDGFGGVFGSDNGVALATTSGNVGFGTIEPGPYKTMVAHEEFGLALQNITSENTWEFFTSPGITGDLSLYYNFSFKGAFSADDGSYGAPSDLKLKKNIKPLGSILSKVNQLRPSSYNFKEAKAGEKASLGFIAQDVNEIFPELVMEMNDERNNEKILALKYDGFAPIAIKAIQELKAIIEAQQLQLEILENRLEALENE